MTALLPAAAVASSCRSGENHVGARLVRDSAGARIVENRAAQWSDAEAWAIGATPLFRILGTDGSETNLLIDPTSIAVDSRGRIIVADGNTAGWHSILVYDQEGAFLFRAGREGQGPGEFRQLWWASAYRGDSIIGFDQATDRVSVFGPSGRYAREVAAPRLSTRRGPRGSMGFTAGVDGAYADGFFLAYPSGYFEGLEGPGLGWTYHELLRLDPDGATWDTLGTFKVLLNRWDGTQQRQVSFSPYPFHAPWGQSLYYGLGDSFEIRRYGPLGQVELIIRKEHAHRPVTEELRRQFIEWLAGRMSGSVPATEAMVERMRRQLEEAPFADTLPAFSHGFVDTEGYLWVENFRWVGDIERAPVASPTVWSIFDHAGVWLGDLETPAGLIVRAATRDRVYGFVVDEFDVKEIEVYPLSRR